MISCFLDEFDCCYKRTVDGKNDLDGVYVFKRKVLTNVDPNCSSNCIYIRLGSEFEGQEYCFGEVFPFFGTTDEECSFPGNLTNPVENITSTTSKRESSTHPTSEFEGSSTYVTGTATHMHLRND